MRSLLRSALISLLATERQARRSAILMFHSIGESPAPFTVRPKIFRSLLSCLKGGGYRFISMNELGALVTGGTEDQEGLIALTFDDGYSDNLSVALPIMEDFSAPGTVYVTIDYLARRVGAAGIAALTEDQLAELARHPLIAVGAHTRSHPRLSQISIDQARTEIEGSRTDLQRITGTVVDHFAYPYGDFSAEVRRAVVKCGFRSAVTVVPGTLRGALDLYALPRIPINLQTDEALLLACLRGGLDRYRSIREVLRI